MASVERLQEIKGLSTSNLPQENPIWPVPERRSEQFSDGNGRQVRLLLRASSRTRLFFSIWISEVSSITMTAFLRRDEGRQGIQQGRFAGACPTRDEDIFLIALDRRTE